MALLCFLTLLRRSVSPCADSSSLFNVLRRDLSTPERFYVQKSDLF